MGQAHSLYLQVHMRPLLWCIALKNQVTMQTQVLVDNGIVNGTISVLLHGGSRAIHTATNRPWGCFGAATLPLLLCQGWRPVEVFCAWLEAKTVLPHHPSILPINSTIPHSPFWIVLPSLLCFRLQISFSLTADQTCHS